MPSGIVKDPSFCTMQHNEIKQKNCFTGKGSKVLKAVVTMFSSNSNFISKKNIFSHTKKDLNYTFNL